jgi:hypothetical protein
VALREVYKDDENMVEPLAVCGSVLTVGATLIAIVGAAFIQGIWVEWRVYYKE